MAKKTKKIVKKSSSLQKSYREAKRSEALPGVFVLAKKLFQLWRFAPLSFLGLVGLYGFFYFVLVQSPETLDFDFFQAFVEDVFGVGSNTFIDSAVLTGTIFGAGLDVGDVGAVYNSILFLLGALALVWMLRNFYAHKYVTVRDSLYHGMTPLVPVLLLSTLLSIQLLPFVAGSYLFVQSFAGDILINRTEEFLIIGVFVGSLIISLLMMVRTIIATFIATIPGTPPLDAFRKAKELVQGRRLLILQRILAFALLTVVAAFAIIIASIALFPPLAILLATAMTICIMPVTISYLFVIYKGLIDEEAIKS